MPSSVLVRRAAVVLAAGLATGSSLVLGASAQAALPIADVTQMVTLDTTGDFGVSAGAVITDMSANGRYVVYWTLSSDASPMGNPGKVDLVYRRDLVTNAVVVVSVKTDGTPADDDNSRDASISADGRYVAFESRATGLTADAVPAGETQVYVRDLDAATPTTTLVSQYNGKAGDLSSEAPSISDDGSRVAFDTYATNFPVYNNHPQVYVWDSSISAVTLASAVDGTQGPGTPGDADSLEPAISGDGTLVAFTSGSQNLTTEQTRQADQIFSRTLASHRTEMVSLREAAPAAGGEGNSSSPSVNRDGSLIAFGSEATDLTSASIPAKSSQVYVRDRSTGTTELISVALDGAPLPTFADFPEISGDGGRVAFRSDASGIAEGVTVPATTAQLYVRDRAERTTLLESPAMTDPLRGGGPADAGAQAVALSSDGTVLAFESDMIDLSPTLAQSRGQGFVRGLPTSFLPTPTQTPTATETSTTAGSQLASTGQDGTAIAWFAGVGIALIVIAAGVLAVRTRIS